MASNQPAPSKDDAPLSFMAALSPAVAYFEPPKQLSSPSLSTSSTSIQADPELILLFSWMGARDAHIAKYINSHRALFPSSRILLARCPINHIVWPPQARKDVDLAIPFIKALIEKETAERMQKLGYTVQQPVKLLIQVFSNGGLSSAIRLHRALRAEFGGSVKLPRHVLIFDCCPGYFHRSNTYAALSQAMPWWMSPVIHVILAVATLSYTVLQVSPAQDANSVDSRAVDLRRDEARRTYIYSSADNIVKGEDVEDNARNAKEAGFLVRTERFEDAMHCACARADGERYWRIVRETWEGEGDTGVVEL